MDIATWLRFFRIPTSGDINSSAFYDKLNEAADEIERLRETLKELATTTYHSADDYRERAKEALQEKT